jgi:hypothetical protein
MPGSALSRIELEGLSVLVDKGGIRRTTTNFFLDVLGNILLRMTISTNTRSFDWEVAGYIPSQYGTSP